MAPSEQDGSVAGNEPSIPFWNTNLPWHLHTDACPPFLTYAFQYDKDRKILATPDALYQPQDWTTVTSLVHNNRPDLFQRVPSELRQYREYCAQVTEQHGSVMAFVVEERLKWREVEARGRPFELADDIKILQNDWPYGFTRDIVHLVVWTKFSLATKPDAQPDEDDLTPECRQQIDKYVDRSFTKHCGERNVLWFKNWSSLKSIHAVEHFHVLLRKPDERFVREVTGGDVSMWKRFGKGLGS